MIAPGTLLQNRYRVIRQIGQGGMGAVYVATDERFHSTVALKETLFDDPGLRKAFEREAHLLNRLRHAALPKVSDHFIEGEGQFLVMEFIAGDDLSELLQKRATAFPLSEVLAWTDQLLDAIDYLHTQEPPIIHRDIKPQNLKLTPRGHIVLLDFGLAKGMPMQTRATATGSVFGFSRNYAPLEQIQGAGTDVRSDLYSLGATVYHLLTGVTPPDALTRATAVINGQPDPLRPAHEVHAQVPQTISEILRRAMAQNAALRPQTAAAMRAALHQAAQQQGTNTHDATHVQPAAPITNVFEEQTKLFNPQSAIRNPQSSAPPAAGDETTIVKPVSAANNSLPQTAPRSSARRFGLVLAGLALFFAVTAGAYTLTRRAAPTAATTTNAPVEPTPAPAPVPSNALTAAPSPATAQSEIVPQTKQPTAASVRRANTAASSKVAVTNEARSADAARSGTNAETDQESGKQPTVESAGAPAAGAQSEQPRANEGTLPTNTRTDLDEEMRRAGELRRRLRRMRQQQQQRPPEGRRDPRRLPAYP